MKQQNECRLSGQVDRVRKIPTKTGAAMCEVILTVRGDHFRVVGFGNLAEYILAHAVAGDELAVTGSLSISNWKDEATGEWRNSFSVTAWNATIHGQEVSYQRRQNETYCDGKTKGQATDAYPMNRQQQPQPQRWEPPTPTDTDYF